MMKTTFFHREKVQVRTEHLFPERPPKLGAFWFLGFSGPIDEQSGMIINLTLVQKIQKAVLSAHPEMSLWDWFQISHEYIQTHFPEEMGSLVVSGFSCPDLGLQIECEIGSDQMVLERKLQVVCEGRVCDLRLRQRIPSTALRSALLKPLFKMEFLTRDELFSEFEDQDEVFLKPFCESSGVLRTL